MKEAKISDIFMSLQGEGPYVGQKQLFIRFYGCSVNCKYCDTKPNSYKVFTKDALLSKVLEFREPYHSISFTGGEPLEQVDFLEEFIPFLKRNINTVVYIETNGIQHENLSRIVDIVDIIAMDIKLPSSTGKGAFWEKHEKFLAIAGSKNIFVKIVITGDTKTDELLKARDMVRKINKQIPIILQPVDPVGNMKEAPLEMLFNLQRLVGQNNIDAQIIPQHHKMWGLK